MQEDFICVAGFDSSFNHVRPVIPNKRLPTSLLKENGGIFGIGAKVDLGSVIPRSECVFAPKRPVIRTKRPLVSI